MKETAENIQGKIAPSFVKETGGGAHIGGKTKIISELPIINTLFKERFSRSGEGKKEFASVTFTRGIPEEVKERVKTTFGLSVLADAECHVLEAKGDTIVVYGSDDRGLFYGLMSLFQMERKGHIPYMLVYDAPLCPERGLKVFLPSKKNIPFFKQFVDMLVFLKYNQIMIEVGGAMEYTKHPEINEGWVKYCEEMSEYSGKTTQIQDHTYPWYKNAIHMENGDGEFLSQAAVSDLVHYCKERMLEVIPEVPSLGHCDYLMLGNHDIAERVEDPYADTYCPSNPKSYEILFDVLEDVIEVFKPTMINIGHDEFYTMAVCDKCRGKSGAEIFAGDIQKIYDFLKERGIKTAIWGDKLLKNAYVPGAGNFGGAEAVMYTPQFHQKDGKIVGVMPATWQAVDMIPKDVEILHWLWSIGEELEDEVLSKGFTIRYGNFEGYLFPHWRAHLEKGSRGAMISNWSTLNSIILQRNGIFFGMSYAYEMFWNHAFNDEDDDYAKIRDKVFSCLYRFKYAGIDELKASKILTYHPQYVEILYTTDYKVDFKFFVDGVFPEADKYDIGDFVFTYEDGTKERIPITFGGNISHRDVEWERRKKENPERGEAIYKVDEHLLEVSMSTLPEKLADKTYYRHPVKNPRPEKVLKNFEVHRYSDKECSILVEDIRYLGDEA